jgi:predicted dehydrogenase
VTEPLRIGIIGASRIAGLSIVSPAAATGTRLVAVAARDRSRAEVFAAEHGVERVHDSYDALLADDEVEAVYNPLANGLHGPWNKRALAAGKHVLGEKPSAANADEAREVAAAVSPGQVFMEALHFPYHPLWHRVNELIAAGAVGTVEHVDVPLLMPDPGADDPRWVLALAGGSTMDLGCYSLAALSLLGQGFLGGRPRVTAARAEERAGHPGVDERLLVDVAFPSGATGSGGSDMDADDVRFALTVVGSEGTLTVPDFPRPHEDDSLVLRSASGAESVERLGSRSSYTFQLEAFTAAVREGAPVTTNAEFSVATMELIDAAYRAAGMEPRTPTPAS